MHVQYASTYASRACLIGNIVLLAIGDCGVVVLPDRHGALVDGGRPYARVCPQALEVVDAKVGHADGTRLARVDRILERDRLVAEKLADLDDDDDGGAAPEAAPADDEDEAADDDDEAADDDDDDDDKDED